MSKYLLLFKLQIQNILEYRAEFLVARVRILISFATMFMIWQAVYRSGGDQIQGYTQAATFTYLIVGQVFNAITWSKSTGNLQGIISSGNLNDLLVKPLNIFGYLLSSEFADKVIDIMFVIAELFVLYLIFRPPIEISISAMNLLLFMMFIPFVALLRFLVSLAISFSTFWYYQNSGWGQRFLIDMLIDFMSGSYFPLEFLPVALTVVLVSMPTSLFFYTPMQLFLGRISLHQVAFAFGMLLVWIGVFFVIDMLLWKKGLKVYGAFGR